ncbi:MAG: glycosyl hydrolase family 18 protein [Bacteroidota bacterium]
MCNKQLILFTFLICLIFVSCRQDENKTSKQKNDFSVIAYYSGNAAEIEKYNFEGITHVIYSFLHLKGNELAVDDSNDSLVIRKLVDLKKQHLKLKVILSLGGWGGCFNCSDVFSIDTGRKEFAKSARLLLEKYHADGLDLDWEYPAIQGVPDHPYKKEDRRNFTLLLRELRKEFGSSYELSFAAGGFVQYLKDSIEWKEVTPLVDKINLMSYDLTNGYSLSTGHHTPLFSSEKQIESTVRAVRWLDSIGVPLDKIVIGSAFYARVWENVDSLNNGLYRPGKFKWMLSQRIIDSVLSKENGFNEYWDKACMAPYKYSSKQKLFATYDNEKSVALKVAYARYHGLGGIMFWELWCDRYKNGLLKCILKNANTYKPGTKL